MCYWHLAIKHATTHRTVPHNKELSNPKLSIVLRLRKHALKVMASGTAGSRSSNHVYKTPFLYNVCLCSSVLTSHTRGSLLHGLVHILTETNLEKSAVFSPVNQTVAGIEFHMSSRSHFDLREWRWGRTGRTHCLSRPGS